MTQTPVILDNDAPAYAGVKQRLERRLRLQCRVGDRLPPVAVLAREMGVGHNNAHQAVRELVREGVLFSRQRTGTFLRRIPDHDGPLRGLQIACTHMREPMPFIQRMIDGLREAVEVAGGTLRETHYQEDSPPTAPDGDVWATVMLNPNNVHMQACERWPRLMVVSTSDSIDPHLKDRCDWVGVDQHHGGTLAGRAMRQLGCDSACFIGARIAKGSVRFDATSSIRLHGFEQAWGDPLADRDLFPLRGYSLGVGGQAFGKWLELSPRPLGVFAATDELAIGFLAASYSHGLVPGRDFYLIGFDGQDNEMAGGSGRDTLTTVRVPSHLMGRTAGEMLLRRVASPDAPPQQARLICSMSYGSSTSVALRKEAP